VRDGPGGYVTEGPGLSAIVLFDGIVYQTNATTNRGLEPLMGFYGLLDRGPKGGTRAAHRISGSGTSYSSRRPSNEQADVHRVGLRPERFTYTSPGQSRAEIGITCDATGSLTPSRNAGSRQRIRPTSDGPPAGTASLGRRAAFGRRSSRSVASRCDLAGEQQQEQVD
jgi:hypothetical protein